MKDAAIFQRAKIETLSTMHTDEETGQHQFAQILLHLVWVQQDKWPLQPGSNHHLQLRSKSHVQTKPPELSYEQISIIVVDDNTVISVRAAARPGCVPHSQRLFQTIFDSLKDYNTIRLLHAGSVKHLAFEIVDSILQENFEIRDMLKGTGLCVVYVCRCRSLIDFFVP